MQERQTQLACALADEEHKLLACVHCGLCLEACPTYVHTGDENDGPRGRIYLMRAVEEGRLAVESRSFSRHIERCLGCRACESVCPAGVEYGQLLEAARARIADNGQRKGWTSRTLRFVLRHVWTRPARLRFAFLLARLLRDSRIPRLLLASKLTKLLPSRIEFAVALLESSAPARLGERAARRAQFTKARGAQTDVEETDTAGVGDAREEASDNKRARFDNKSATLDDKRAKFDDKGAKDDDRHTATALLFEGCVTEGLFARVNRATARVLEANGCRVSAPRGQVCCGALHAHAGDIEGSRALARRNIEAFETPENEASEATTGAIVGKASDAAIVTNAGGCGAMLKSYAHLLARDVEFAERARSFSARVRDVSQQLSTTGVREGAWLDELTATYDASCHLLHGQKAQVEPLRVLAAIAGLSLAPLEGSDVCCGGAGVYNLLERELSTRVLDEKLRHVSETGASVVATGNPGCHMQIGAGARLAGLRLNVCHPVELLDESYRRAGVYEK